MSKFMGCFCFHPKSHQKSVPHPPTAVTKSASISNYGNKNREKVASASTTTSTSSGSIQKVEESKLVIYVSEEKKKYEVPERYLSYPTFRALLERSKEEFEKIKQGGGGGSISISSCPIELFERILKLVKRKEREEACRELSYDPRLWKHI